MKTYKSVNHVEDGPEFISAVHIFRNSNHQDSKFVSPMREAKRGHSIKIEIEHTVCVAYVGPEPSIYMKPFSEAFSMAYMTKTSKSPEKENRFALNSSSVLAEAVKCPKKLVS